MVSRLFLIYAALIIVSYAVTEELLGPRHRFQLTFILAWMQFHFLWQMRPAKSQQALPLRPVALQAARRLAAA